jgi:hypothetical protein
VAILDCSAGLRFIYKRYNTSSVHIGVIGSDFKTILYVSAAPIGLLDAATFGILHGDFLAKRSHLFMTVHRRAFSDYRNGFLNMCLF